MNKREWNSYKCFVLGLCIISTVVFVLYMYCYTSNNIPKNITIRVDEMSEFQSNLPITANFDKKSIGVISVDNRRINSISHNVSIKDKFKICSNKIGDYNVYLKAFGVINLKKMKVKVINDNDVVVGGIPLGIYMETDGLLVLGTSKVKTVRGMEESKAHNIIKPGDYIYGLNGKYVKNKKEFIDLLNRCTDEDVILSIKRNGEKMNIVVKRIYIKQNQYKLGIWIRNDMQGIGTMTYYNPMNKTYGALGHGINDVDTSTLMSVKKGAIYRSNIIDIIKGEKNNPGELVGVINQSNESELGSLVSNTLKGIYGLVDNKQYKRIMNEIGNDKLNDNYKIGLKQEIKKGKAIIRTKIDNEIKEYDIVIEDIDMKNSNSNKGFIIKIIDKVLLEKTGGIVQGMSGSPIIQSGKLIGAVTHVFVNDPTRGYGIFIENMLDTIN